jgi:hypothetical protein
MQGLPKALGRCAAVGVPVLGLLMALAPAAGASTASDTGWHGHHPSHGHYSAQALASAKSGLQRMLKSWHGMDQWKNDHGLAAAKASSNANGIEALTQVQSSNWSGYADTGTGFTKVTAQWTEPTAKCTSTSSLAAFWVGIDGFASDSVEQDGTIIECSGGQAFYFDWWELFPTNAVQVVNSVNPGDAISASVVRSGTSYKLSVTDSTTTSDSFSTTQMCSSCANSSAEWIAEAPSGSSGVEPLSNFGVFKLHNATVGTTSKSGDIISFTDDEITMVDSAGTVEAQPTSLAPLGGRFNVTWKSST